MIKLFKKASLLTLGLGLMFIISACDSAFLDLSGEYISYSIHGDTLTYLNQDYDIISVDGGDKDGERLRGVAVDIGFGDRLYFGLTNDYGQLVYVLADEITLQNEQSEPVNSSGRYYDDEANVPGTEHEDLDQGHIIADSLGGVANAYNITPQNSTLNRHGDQAYMERNIREAGGCTNFVATILYDNTSTQTPSSYKYEYVLMGNSIVDEFLNINPEETIEKTDISEIDTNSDGVVTIKEAEEAGYNMPITSNHWLYAYMKDSDADGVVGE